MDEQERIAALEAVLARMLQPVRGVPFNVVMKAMANQQVVKINRSDPHDVRLLKTLKRVITICGDELKAMPILRPRPNEVGNDVEAYVARALVASGLSTSKPTALNGRVKSTGYPDLLFHDAAKRPTYLECKIYSEETALSSMRSFYLSPSDGFKVSLGARHLLLAFRMRASAVPRSRNSKYIPTGFSLIDLHDLLCDVKYEFNSDNRRLYAPGLILDQGLI